MKKSAILKPPAVVLVNPKYPHNVGAAIRGCACFGVDHLFWTGDRVTVEDGERLPREERMKGYEIVNKIQTERPLAYFSACTPVAVEVRENSESLTTFDHPDDAVYIFGPEDGFVPKSFLHLCHRFVHIPSHFCLNLAAAVNVALYDRRIKRQMTGQEPMLPLKDMLLETRAWT